MRGSNHSIMNIITAGMTFTTGMLILKTNSPEFLKTAVVASRDFLMDNQGLHMVFYVPLIGFMYLLGSLLPDIDHPHSKIGHMFHVPVKHRTWTHAIYMPIILFVLGIFFRWLFWLALGYLFHLVWDSFSASGIDWFYPKKNKRHKLKAYYTSQPSEHIFVGISMAVLASYAIIVFQHIYHFIK